MSLIGKKPIPLEKGAKISVAGQTITVEGGKTRLTFDFDRELSVVIDDDAKHVLVTRVTESKKARAMHGTTRAIISNMIEGVTKGFVRELEVVGVGWNAQLQGKTVVLNVGYAHPRKVEVPDGVNVEIQQNKIKVSGPDKQLVGQTAAAIRSQRKPEPYNGKGIKYTDEVIIRKQGKAFAGGG